MKNYDIAAYIWPAYTGDEKRTRMFWPEGMGEWQSVKNARENSIDYKQEWYETWKQRKPLWGYVNEANADVMRMQIDCAADHGVNVFIYDWYWYDNRPFLENCLNDGFMKAKNNDRMKFYLMWANHDVPHVWSIEHSDDIGWEEFIWQGFVTKDVFESLVDRWIEKYFSHPSYYKIDGKPVFMIYDLANFIKGFGSHEAARNGIEFFRKKVTEAGFPGLHLQVVLWDIDAQNYSGVDGERCDVAALYSYFGFDSASHYQWVSFQEPGDYVNMTKRAAEEYSKMQKCGICYLPHVSLGWDNNPRFKKYRPDVATNATPENVEAAFRQAKKYVDTHELPAPLITVNSWNEWTETSYLEPDELYGYGYLEAIKRVFIDGE